jgi:flagellar motor switch protein FliM
MVSLGLSPYDGNGVLELNPSLVFPILEMLLGGSGKSTITIQRDITEIEQKLLDGLFRIILHDLREAWKAVTCVDFTIESMEPSRNCCTFWLRTKRWSPSASKCGLARLSG